MALYRPDEAKFAVVMDKNLFIIAGCNGAGKTTASFTILPDIIACQEFVNADEIAKGLSPFHPEGVAFESGRIMLQPSMTSCCRARALHLKPHWQVKFTGTKFSKQRRKDTRLP